MKLTKLLAMLLALCMILCCFAACGGKDDDQDDDDDEKVEEKDEDEEDDDKSKDDEEDDKSKEDEDDEDDDKGDEDAATTEDADLEGRWKGEMDLSGLISNDLEGDYSELVFGVVIEFRDDGNYTTTAVDIPSVDEFIDFFISVYGEDNMSEEDAEEAAESVIDEIEADPRVMYGDYTVEGNVISLDEGYCDITFEIDGEEMSFENIRSDIDAYYFLKDAKFEKQ